MEIEIESEIADRDGTGTNEGCLRIPLSPIVSKRRDTRDGIAVRTPRHAKCRQARDWCVPSSDMAMMRKTMERNL